MSSTERLDTTARIETPEHIAFEFELAGPWRRMWAYGLDLGLRGMLLAAVGLLAWGVAELLPGLDDLLQAHLALVLLAWFGLEWFYHVLFEWLWDGRTPGKRALGLKVVKGGGHPLGPLDAVLRNLVRGADVLPAPWYLVGMLVSAADPHFRRLGDMAADTVVVVDRPRFLRRPAVIEPPPAPGELDALPRRPTLSVEERKVLDAFVHRFRDMGPARREEICAAFAEALAERYGMTEPRNSARFLQLVYARSLESAVPVGRRRPA